ELLSFPTRRSSDLNRAAHCHLSWRTLASSFSLIIQLCQRCHVIGSYSRSLKNHLCWQYFVKTASNCSFRKLNSAFRLFRLVLPASATFSTACQIDALVMRPI